MTTDKIAEIRARHEEIDAWVKETRTFGPAAAHTDRATLLAEVERLRREAERLRAERDTLLLDAREFVRWFSYHFGHVDTATISPWRMLNNRLAAHADTLAALDAAMAKTGKEGVI